MDQRRSRRIASTPVHTYVAVSLNAFHTRRHAKMTRQSADNPLNKFSSQYFGSVRERHLPTAAVVVDGLLVLESTGRWVVRTLLLLPAPRDERLATSPRLLEMIGPRWCGNNELTSRYRPFSKIRLEIADVIIERRPPWEASDHEYQRAGCRVWIRHHQQYQHFIFSKRLCRLCMLSVANPP